MTHFLFARRSSMFAEARVIHMVPVPGEAPTVPDTPPPVEAKAEAPDPRSTFRKAQERIKVHGEKLKALQAKLKPLQTLQTRHEAGEKVDQKEMDQHGIKDADGDGKFKVEIDAKVKEMEDATKPHQEAVDGASQESETSLSAIEASGPGGKIDAAFMRVESVMKNPNASIGEKIAAVLVAFTEMQNAFKGLTIPAAAPGVPGSKGPEVSKSSPSSKSDHVRSMMAKEGKTNIADLKTKKTADVAAARKNVDELTKSKNTEMEEINRYKAWVTRASDELKAKPDDPKAKENLSNYETWLAESEGKMKLIESKLAPAQTDLRMAEADLVNVTEAQNDAKKSVDDFGQQKEIIEAKLKVLKELPDLDEEKKQAIDDLINVLDWEDAALADNGIDVTLEIGAANMPSFLEKMTKAGLDPKALKVGAGGVIEDPVAFQVGMDQFITKAMAAATK